MATRRTGQHIEREARYEATGLSPAQRKEYVRQLMNRGWSERQIASRLGIGASTAHYICAELKGRPRQSVSLRMCEGCWGDFPKDQLGPTGLCPECRTMARHDSIRAVQARALRDYTPEDGDALIRLVVDLTDRGWTRSLVALATRLSRREVSAVLAKAGR
jgi:transcriptional regulator with XRE-family HTH domain